MRKIFEEVIREKEGQLKEIHQIGISEVRTRLDFAREKIENANQEIEKYQSLDQHGAGGVFKFVSKESVQAYQSFLESANIIIELEKTP